MSMIEALERSISAAAERENNLLDQQRVLAENVSSLLAQWHAWSAGYAMTNGYPTGNSACRGARSSRQYDDANGGLDAHIDHVVMEAVDAVIDAIQDPWRTALSVQARNLRTGSQVWSSPRLPACVLQRSELLVAARKKFVEGLMRGNLL